MTPIQQYNINDSRQLQLFAYRRYYKKALLKLGDKKVTDLHFCYPIHGITESPCQPPCV